ncbi:type I restriction endonuclease [uncultured Microscilla sp.]|uniref:type I restriction endonuclease subunit R n=1 Tax=uncultured Microscilla sp. TaxID=432653 RepID=UPI00261FAFCC|nr:type I restriction endonuclease [uncultured Microscilla sp.]
MASGSKEADFEAHIVNYLTTQDHYQEISAKAYDKTLCLIPEELIEFIKTSQPKAYQALQKQYGAATDEKITANVATHLRKHKTLHGLHHGVKDRGQKLDLVYFKPAHTKTPEHARWYAQNRLTVVRQLRYSSQHNNSIDLVWFVNGIPVATAELKNALTGQNHVQAMRQYQQDRDPRGEPLLEFQRCLVHFAVGTEQVYMTTHLRGKSTFFLPFNQGLKNHHPQGYAVGYLWEDVLTKDSLLDLIQNFISLQTNTSKEYNAKTQRLEEKKTPVLLFPRFHQRRAVHRLLAALRQSNTGTNYLIQHSAGSGKSNTITWLAYCLANFYQAPQHPRAMFDSVIVVTDRRVLNRQIQDNMRQLDKRSGVVAYLDNRSSSADLRQAIEEGKRVIITTIQKFPYISDAVAGFANRKYAILIDEAHSSQSGETSRHMRKALSLADAAAQEADTPTLDDIITEDIERKGQQPNVWQFAFTATPKPKTITLFGTMINGQKRAFDEYTMEQAIKEGFIRDVLQNYMSFKRYYKLATRQDVPDQEYDKKKTVRVLSNYVDLQDHAIETKARIMLEHFASHTQNEILGKARAMLVTRSRLHAVRYQRKFEEVMREMNLPYGALVAFSGKVHDPETGEDYTEAGMNALQGRVSIPEALKLPQYRILIVANKFQTGFDEPLLHTMFVDKQLGGANAVQTLSRLNRTTKVKTSTMVLDFVNEPEQIQADFQHFYGGNYIPEDLLTDPNILYHLLTELEQSQVYEPQEVEMFAEVFFTLPNEQERLQKVLDVVVTRFEQLPNDEGKAAFKGNLQRFNKMYKFLSQIMTFADPDLEKHYVFFIGLIKKLPYATQQLPLDVVNDVELDSYRVQYQYTTHLELESGDGETEGLQPGGSNQNAEEEADWLSKIIQTLNDAFGADLTEEDKVEVKKMRQLVYDDDELMSYFNAQNSKDNIQDKFNGVIDNLLLNFINTKLDFYSKMTNDKVNASLKNAWFTELYNRLVRGAK